MNRVLSLVVVVSVVALTMAFPARAEGPSQRDPVSAQSFYQRGRDAAARGDIADACANFEESLRLDPTAGTLFNLAACEEQLGRLASALQHLKDGLDQIAGEDSRREPAQRSLTALERRVPLLAVRLAPRAEAVVFRDGVELANRSLGMALPVNPGLHRITVRAPGHADALFSIKIAAGERETLDVAPGAPNVEAPVKPRPTSGLRTAGWVTGGLGLGALAAGGLTGALAFERSQVVHDHCDGTVCDARGLDALDSSQRFASAATLTLGLAAVLLTTGVTMWVLGKPAHAAPRSSALTFRQF